MTVLLQINFLTATVNAVNKIKNVDLKIAFHFRRQWNDTVKNSNDKRGISNGSTSQKLDAKYKQLKPVKLFANKEKLQDK